ncbi:TetR/AcrR family transcriptional regulator [Tomitella biformata]|uniref:TetR/AcrR family transcriptional regulator n=1 Tax=Tomitella biformata TaxID=630403 RepID=UPI0009FBB2DC|nr:TetR/AcrR family transcriptional regulator [Tomitella biformata]
MSEPAGHVEESPAVIAGGGQLRRAAKPRRQASYDEEVQLLIRSAEAVMLGKGCTEPPKIAEIVRAAEMSNQAFYRHFRSRDDVIVATYEQGLLNIHAYLAHRVFKQVGLEARLAAWIDGVLAQIEDPELSELSRVIIWNMGQIARTKSEIKPIGHARLSEVLCGVLAQAEVPEPGRNATFIQTLVLGLTTSYLESGQSPTAADRAHLLRFCLGALAEH